MKTKTITKKKFFKNGAGEAISFAAVLPMFFVVLYFIIASFQTMVAKEAVQRYAYDIARQTVIARSLDEARSNANAEMDAIVTNANYLIKNTAKVDVQFINSVAKHGKSGEWNKGNYVMVTFEVQSNTANLNFKDLLNFSITRGTIQKTSIIMMIERSKEAA